MFVCFVLLRIRCGGKSSMRWPLCPGSAFRPWPCFSLKLEDTANCTTTSVTLRSVSSTRSFVLLILSFPWICLDCETWPPPPLCLQVGRGFSSVWSLSCSSRTCASTGFTASYTTSSFIRWAHCKFNSRLLWPLKRSENDVWVIAFAHFSRIAGNFLYLAVIYNWLHVIRLFQATAGHRRNPRT